MKIAKIRNSGNIKKNQSSYSDFAVYTIFLFSLTALTTGDCGYNTDLVTISQNGSSTF
jgi:hypothetical protein